MNRREILTIAGLAAAFPRVARGQAARGVRIGYLGTDRSSPLGAAIYEAFVEAMRTSGYVEGRNLVIDFRALERPLPALNAEAADLVRAHADLLLTDGTEAALSAAVHASSTVPIVMIATNFDPVARGYVKSLASPGGNVTGVFLRQTELAEKQTELLHQAVPDRTRLAVLWDGESNEQSAAAQKRATSLGLSVHSEKLERPPYDFDAAFERMRKASPQMLLVLSSPHFTPYRAKVAQLAIAQGWPTMFIFKTYAQAGGLMSYGADYIDAHRHAASYAARILAGAKASDLPIEQPNKFELVVNLRTAKALGLALPAPLLLRADELIE